MSQKKIKLVFKGFFDACSAVAKTMGYEGSLAIIKKEAEGGFTLPVATKDGVTVSNAIFFKNKYKNIGAFYSKQACSKTLVIVGDATTTTAVFAKNLVKATLRKGKYFFNSKVKDGINLAQKEFEERLKQLAKPTDKSNILSIATTSANNSSEIGKLVLEAYEAVGSTGTITVQQDTDSPSTSLKISQGMLLDKGWKSPQLINKSNGGFEAEKVNVLLFEGNITTDNAQQISEFLHTKEKEPILIICEHISEDIVTNLGRLVSQKILNACAIEAPFFAEQRKAILQDIAVYLDTEVFIQGTSTEMKFGLADKVVIDQDTTSLIKETVSQEVIAQIESLKEQLTTTSEKEFFQKRISMLGGKAAIIKVGEVTDFSRKEKFDRVEDSVAAVKAAVSEGIVAGGGSTLVYIASQMNETFEDKDVQFGYNCLKKALRSPYKTILKNAKVNYKKYIGSSEKTYGEGYNVKTHQLEQLEKSGIVDSVKSQRVALENAVSVSNLLLNTKVIIS